MALIIFRAQQPLLLFKVEKMATQDTFIKESGVGEKSASICMSLLERSQFSRMAVCMYVCVCMVMMMLSLYVTDGGRKKQPVTLSTSDPLSCFSGYMDHSFFLFINPPEFLSFSPPSSLLHFSYIHFFSSSLSFVVSLPPFQNVKKR